MLLLFIINDIYCKCLFKGQLGHGRTVKFLSEPKELGFNLLPEKIVNISVGENTCAAVTGKLT